MLNALNTVYERLQRYGERVTSSFCFVTAIFPAIATVSEWWDHIVQSILTFLHNLRTASSSVLA